MSANSRTYSALPSRISYVDLQNILYFLLFFVACVYPFSPFYCILCASLLSSVLQYSGSEYLASLNGVLSRSKRDHGCARCRIWRMYVYLTELVASVISNCVVIREGRRITHPIAWGNSDPCVPIRTRYEIFFGERRDCAWECPKGILESWSTEKEDVKSDERGKRGIPGIDGAVL